MEALVHGNLMMKKAIEYLKTTHWPIYQIAETVGIGDGDYLTKLLKKSAGKSPRQIRKDAAEATTK